MINPPEKKPRISQDFPSNSSFSFSGFSAKKAIPVKIRSLLAPLSSPVQIPSRGLRVRYANLITRASPHAGVFSSVLFSRLVPDERGRHVVHVRATSIRFHAEIDRVITSRGFLLIGAALMLSIMLVCGLRQCF